MKNLSLVLGASGHLGNNLVRELLSDGHAVRATWEKVLNDAGLITQRMTLDRVYDKYLLGEGEYPMTIFIGQKI